jgi:hypothetical protein
MSGHPLPRLRMHMADVVRMCIAMGIDIDTVVTLAEGIVWFMIRAYKTAPAGWLIQVGGCWCVRLSLALSADRPHHADTHAHSHGHRHRHHGGAAGQHCPAA